MLTAKSAVITGSISGVGLAVARGLAEEGSTCNAICLGYVQTPLVEMQIEDTAKARGISGKAVMRDVLLAMSPTKRFVPPEQIGALVVYHAGDAAAPITGRALTMDGGWTAQ